MFRLFGFRFKITRRAWVEESGSAVILLRVPKADITFSWCHLDVYLHDGQPMPRRWKTELGEHNVIFRQQKDIREIAVESCSIQ
jgi:hypothetical protein